VEQSSTADDDAPATAPLIVNGLTVRPREKVSLWYCGISLLPDFAVLIVAAGLGVRQLLRYLDARGAIEELKSKTEGDS
jgi:hypothetical protein